MSTLAPDTVFSCVVDNHPRLLDQGYLWVNCLLHHQGLKREQLVVHFTPTVDPKFLGWLKHEAINTVSITPFDTRSPHCNKLCQLDTFYRAPPHRVILMDCDTAWIGDKPLPSEGPVAAKIVDDANPASSILERIFQASGLGAPAWKATGLGAKDDKITDRNNCNGGLYMIDGSIIEKLGESWKRWARWCLDNRELFGPSHHFDQVSFALAARELGIETRLIGTEWNFPTNFPKPFLPDIDPQIVHYHRNTDDALRVRFTGLETPDKSIGAFNAKMRAFLDTKRPWN